MSKDRVRREFGAHAEHYLDSAPHARGASLAQLLELTRPQPHWRVLDVATGAGHTALTFAPFVARVWATDLTERMLELTAAQARERGLDNVVTQAADAEALPFADGSFELVTCRIAPHHFPEVAAFAREAARVLDRDGLLAVIDNIVPAGPPGDYVNALEKLRDPSHGRCLRLTEWRETLAAAGLTLEHEEVLEKPMVFGDWASRHDADMQRALRAMLTEVGGEAAAFLRPEAHPERDGELIFHLREGVFLARKATAPPAKLPPPTFA